MPLAIVSVCFHLTENDWKNATPADRKPIRLSPDRPKPTK